MKFIPEDWEYVWCKWPVNKKDDRLSSCKLAYLVAQLHEWETALSGHICLGHTLIPVGG